MSSTISPVYGFKEDPHSSHNEISKWVNKSGIKKVLDIGCAGGFMARALGNKWNGELIGIEKDSSWLNSDRLKKYKKIYWLDLEKESIDKTLRKQDRNFDAVVAADVLEHLENPTKSLKEICKVLKPKGLVMISLPNANYFPVFIIRLIFPSLRMSKGPLDKTHKHFYSLRTAKKMVESNNFEVLKVHTTPPPISLIFHKFAKTSYFKLIYNLNYYLSVIIPNIFAYQLLFLVQLKTKPLKSK